VFTVRLELKFYINLDASDASHFCSVEYRRILNRHVDKLAMMIGVL